MPSALAVQNMTRNAGLILAEDYKPQAKMQKLPLLAKQIEIDSTSAFHQTTTSVVEICKPPSRITDLHASAKQYQSSGSEHEPSSVCLAAMVDEFMEDQAVPKCKNFRPKDGSRSSEECDLLEVLKGLLACSSRIELNFLADVTRAVGVVKEQAKKICNEHGADCTSGCLKRAAMIHLRQAGYNAAICKSRWDHAGGFPGGDYEYMDVLIESSDTSRVERLMVDIDFRGQFEIARPTERYSKIFEVLPQIYIGTPERLQQVINLVSDGVRESLKQQGMPLPPWRKPDYMRAKWFSAYRRTTNELIPPRKSSKEVLFLGMRNWDCPKIGAEVELGLASGTPGMINEITAVLTDWKPPAVVKCRKPSRTAGLASVLMEAGLYKKLPEETRKLSMVAVS